MRGIDVSKHNGNINWQKVKNAGIEFAILRVGYGMYENQKDAQFENNYEGATSVGIPVGVYTYSYAKSVAEAEKEADRVIKWLNGRKLNLPVYFDIEDNSQQKLDKTILDNMCRAFCNKIEKAGYSAGIYANKYWLTSVISGIELGKRYTIWVAQYSSNCTYNGDYAIWQYSSDGKVDGINGRVDMNDMRKNIINGSVTPTPSSKPTPTDITGDITYQVYAYDLKKKKEAWLPEVVNDNGYGGNKGHAISGFRAKSKFAKLSYQAHLKGKPKDEWLDVVTSDNYKINSNDGNSFAGILGKPIDCIRIWSDKGYVSYRVEELGSNGYLPYVNKADNTPNGYAGIFGTAIDKLQMK